MHGGAVYLFGVSQDSFFAFEPLVFAGLNLSVANLALLKSPHVQQAQTILLVAFDFQDSAPNTTPAREYVCNLRHINTGKAVQQRQASRGVKGEQGLILGMDRRQLLRQLLQDANRRRLIVDKNSSLASGGNLAAEDN